MGYPRGKTREELNEIVVTRLTLKELQGKIKTDELRPIFEDVIIKVEEIQLRKSEELDKLLNQQQKKEQ